jgi:hypothetical protein
VLNNLFVDEFLNVLLVVSSLNFDVRPGKEAISDISVRSTRDEDPEGALRARQQELDRLDETITRARVAFVQGIQYESGPWVEIHRLEQLFSAGLEAEVRPFECRFTPQVSELLAHLSRMPRSGRQLASITSKDGKWLPTLLFVPIAVEERKPLRARGTFKAALDMVDNPGGKEGFSSAS